MTKRNKILCFIFIILILITGFCVFMVNYTEYKFQKKHEQIINDAQKDTQRLLKLLNEYGKYQRVNNNNE